MLKSQIDGFWSFAAPFSFSLHRGTGRSGCRLAPKEKENLMSITGTVKFFNEQKGYGFIAPDNGEGDAFVHISAVERAGMTTLQQNQRVSYDLEQDKRGKKSAVNLVAAA